MNSSKKISPQRNTPKDLVKCIGLLVAILLAASLTNDLLWNGEARLALDRYVPTMPQPFADLKILLEGCDTYAHSGWASFWDQVDYAGLQYNYPRWWEMIGRIGVGVNHLKPLSFVLLVVYAICVLTIIWFVAGWKCIFHPKFAYHRILDDVPLDHFLPLSELKRLRLLDDVTTVIDAGAHNGVFSKAIAVVLPKVRVLAFEPSKPTFERAHSRINLKKDLI